MPVERISIEQFLSLAKHHPVLDVRSPGEFRHAHIPGAYSFPLFSDEQRKIVGTAYKTESREQAIKLGLDFFGVRMRAMVEEAGEIVASYYSQQNQNGDLEKPSSNVILVHCWRGGMRSAAVAWLLEIYGYKVYSLNGGYKQFRRYVLDTFSLPFEFNILGGYTGSGKTIILNEMERTNHRVVDLEKIAGHKGSAFGNLDLLPQPGQEMFENQLAMVFRKFFSEDPLAPIWLEDESQRVGLVNIPNQTWNRMRASKLFFLDIPFETRLENIVLEYGQSDSEKLSAAISRIAEKLGHLNAKTAILFLNEGKISECFRVLLSYYDRFYLRSLHNRKAINSLLHTFQSKSTTSENARLLLYHAAFNQQEI